MVSRWRIFRKPIIAEVSTVVEIVKATVCLHNFVIDQESVIEAEKRYITSTTVDRENESGDLIPGDWRQDVNSNFNKVKRTSTNMYSRNAEIMREQLTHYFLNEGAVSFQWTK